MGTKKVKTPECDKLVVVSAESQKVGNFLTWLSEHDMFIASYQKVGYLGDERAFPISDSTERLLARYFDIDLDKVERERFRLVASLQKSA